MVATGRRDRRIGFVAVALSVVCVVSVSVTALALMVPSIRARMNADLDRSGYIEGDQIDLDPAAYESADYALFLFSRASCRACQASRSIMAAMVSDVGGRRDVRVMLVAGTDPAHEEVAFARAIGLDASRVVQANLTKLRLRYVPTVVLTNRAGRVLLVREGLLTELDRVEIIRTASSAVPN